MVETLERLERSLERLGYSESHRARNVVPPGCADGLAIAAFTQVQLHDLGTSAIAGGFSESAEATSHIIDLARYLAAPFALVVSGPDIQLHSVGSQTGSDRLIARDFEGFAGDQVIRALSPNEVQAAKFDTRQLSLFPVDVELLRYARNRSAESLSARVSTTFVRAVETGDLTVVDAARLTANALAAVIVKDKYRSDRQVADNLVEYALQRHGSYFESLARFDVEQPELTHETIRSLSDGLDYAQVDARTINRIYEDLAVSDSLRKELGIFYTPHEFADEIMKRLPMEEIQPDERFVLDPACGSGNLLLAATERLQRISAPSLSPSAQHSWLNTHVMGCDIDPVAVEIAKLSFLVSSLPLGNSWRVETADFLKDELPVRPSIVVSNPPWSQLAGSRDEKANAFLDRSVGMLANGGLIACVLPATWLSSDAGYGLRSSLFRSSEIFEVWRLPRDLFRNARYPTAVVFLRKTHPHERTHFAFRWVGAGQQRRARFLEERKATWSSVVRIDYEARTLLSDPLRDVLATLGDVHRLAAVAATTSGIVQNTKNARFADSGEFPALPRGSKYQTYREIATDEVRWVDSGRDFGTGNRSLSPFGPNQILVQAHRNPDTAWRLRPVPDTRGVAPSNAWHAIRPHDPSSRSMYALLAILASSFGSAWIGGGVATKNIPKWAIESLPVPTEWELAIEALATYGEDLASGEQDAPFITQLEDAVWSLYPSFASARQAVTELMAGSKAPEGAIRFPEVDLSGTLFEVHRNPPANDVNPASVLDIEASYIRVWVLGGPEEGELVRLPDRMPGWLVKKDSVFDVVGSDLTQAKFEFHRTSYLTDEMLFGMTNSHA